MSEAQSQLDDDLISEWSAKVPIIANKAKETEFLDDKIVEDDSKGILM